MRRLKLRLEWTLHQLNSEFCEQALNMLGIDGMAGYKFWRVAELGPCVAKMFGASVELLFYFCTYFVLFLTFSFVFREPFCLGVMMLVRVPAVMVALRLTE